MNAEQRMIGPDEAAQLLRGNVNNRGVKQANLLRIMSDMRSGNFDSGNGQTIVINSNNELIDGQHRLMSIVQTGTSHEFIVVTNDDPEVGARIDQGVSRSLTDMLNMGGIKDAPILNSTIRMLKADSTPKHKKESDYALYVWADKHHPGLQAFWDKYRERIVSAYNSSGKVLTKPEFLYYLYKQEITGNDAIFHKFIDLLDYMKQEPKGVKAPTAKFKYCLDSLRELKGKDIKHRDKKLLRMSMIDYLCHLETAQIPKGIKLGRVSSKESFGANAKHWKERNAERRG